MSLARFSHSSAQRSGDQLSGSRILCRFHDSAHGHVCRGSIVDTVCCMRLRACSRAAAFAPSATGYQVRISARISTLLLSLSNLLSSWVSREHKSCCCYWVCALSPARCFGGGGGGVEPKERKQTVFIQAPLVQGAFVGSCGQGFLCSGCQQELHLCAGVSQPHLPG